MGYFQVRYVSRVVNYDRTVFIRLATDLLLYCAMTWRSLVEGDEGCFSSSDKLLCL